jgi:crotonobetainyl-CoA:carnitine CoA-transferase CaiB-like acyl-CoA transferase
MQMSKGPLSGIKVVDFSRVLAGPHCTKTLHDLGADVTKIEPPRPDVSRSALPKNDTMSYYYIQQNTGKRNISLDLNYAEAREIAMRLCKEADVIVENFRAGTLAFFGLDYESVRAVNPRVVYASISGYGQGGPLSHRSAYAPTVHAESGFTATLLNHLGGDLMTDRHDPYAHADIYAGLEAAIGVLAALHRRAVTGEGQYIDVAMAATMVAVNERVHVELSDYDLGDEPPALGASMSPFFHTSTGEKITIATSVISSLTFPLFIGAMRRADLARDPRFLTPELRRKHVTDLYQIIQEWILTFDSLDTLDAQLDEVKLAFGVVRDLRDFASSEWSTWWGAVEEVDDRAGGVARVPGKPWRFSADPLHHPGVPAFRGEHNMEVLSELGYSLEQIESLTRRGIMISDPIAGPANVS